jgi:restriction endonuclease
MPILERIVDSLVELNESFPHLARLEDGRRKVDDARRALRTLKELLSKENLVLRAERARRELRTEAERSREQAERRRADLKSLSDRFLALCAEPKNPELRQRRGLDFQTLLRDLFALHDLEPRGSFARAGDQVDGSISLDGKFILIETKWETTPVEPSAIRDFQGKVKTNRLAATLGMFISMSGYTENAIQVAGSGEIVVILLDGTDMACVFQGLIDFREMLRRKLRQAADKGQPLYRLGAE